MIHEHGIKFLINFSNYEVIANLIRQKTEKYRVIMNEQIMTRAIYQLPETLGGTVQQWLRIRVGDIDCDGNSKCTISYRKKSNDESYAELVKLETSD